MFILNFKWIFAMHCDRSVRQTILSVYFFWDEELSFVSKFSQLRGKRNYWSALKVYPDQDNVLWGVKDVPLVLSSHGLLLWREKCCIKLTWQTTGLGKPRIRKQLLVGLAKDNLDDFYRRPSRQIDNFRFLFSSVSGRVWYVLVINFVA